MIETLVALVILMIAFSFGMIIFMKVTSAGATGKNLRIDNHCQFLSDSLVQASNGRNMQVIHDEIVYKVSFKPYFEQPGLLLMNIHAEDVKGNLLTEYKRVVIDHEREKN